MPAKKFFFLKEKIIDKTIKLSIYIKNLLHENTTISLIQLVDAGNLLKVAVLLPPKGFGSSKNKIEVNQENKKVTEQLCIYYQENMISNKKEKMTLIKKSL